VKPVVKRVALGFLGTLAAVTVGALTFAEVQARAFDASIERVYELPLPVVTLSADPAVLARGKHVTEALGACTSRSCHGADLAGGASVDMGPVATLTGPNITSKGMLSVYSDGELARLVRHGVKRDGRSVAFMPVQDFAWLSDADVSAMISYLRTVPGVDRPNGASGVKLLGKVLDRRGLLVLDVARRIGHETPDLAPPPSETRDYGAYVARLCVGCHGEHLSGGPIPGAPSSFATPLNLTPDATGMKGWTYEDFDALMTRGTRKNGKQLDPFMPLESFGKMDVTEKKALHAYLMGLPPLPLGGR
jgi:mono/diheme cytochrome c family protein